MGGQDGQGVHDASGVDHTPLHGLLTTRGQAMVWG